MGSSFVLAGWKIDYWLSMCPLVLSMGDIVIISTPLRAPKEDGNPCALHVKNGLCKKSWSPIALLLKVLLWGEGYKAMKRLLRPLEAL